MSHIYEDWLRQREDGTSEDDFSLTNEDGLYYFHMPEAALSSEQVAAVIKVTAALNGSSWRGLEDAFRDFSAVMHPMQGIDALHTYLLRVQNEINPWLVYRNCINIVLNSAAPAAVKYALGVISIVRADDPDLHDVIRNIGTCGEYTYYAVMVIEDWKHGTKEIYKLLQQVSGWGRTLGLERFLPDSEEMQNWVLLHGYQGLAGYGALTAWNKGNGSAYLDEDRSVDEFLQITYLFRGLLEESNVKGISETDEADVRKYLSMVRKMPVLPQVQDVLFELRDWCGSSHETLRSSCENILQEWKC